MISLRSAGLVLLAVLLVVVAGAWWYFFGPNTVPAAKLVPGDTLVFATIPNGAGIGAGYETSQLKKIVDSPNTQPAFDYLTRTFGPKNLDLLKLFLPNLSGQSFIAVTHFDADKPEETGFVAAMKPKPGLQNFDAFVQQVNASYPDLLRETTTGKGNLLGVDYQWIQGTNSPGRVCVARYRGWIVTAWGEASLQDWLERAQGKPTTPSLADNADYQKSIDRVGKDSQAIVYFDDHSLAGLLKRQLGKDVAADAAPKPPAGPGGLALGSRFSGGDIVDNFSLLEPREAQLDHGLSATPCAFETLKFTGPNTRFYAAANLNWQQIWKKLQDPATASGSLVQGLAGQLDSWAKSENLDVQKNIIDPLGQEFSLQMEWDPDSTYPDLGLFLKVDKQDDFKPTIAALIDTLRKEFSTSAVITEITSGDHRYATLKMVNPMPVAPTITEDGPYFAFFLSEQHAVRSFSRDDNAGLLHNDDFNHHLGDRQGATGLVYFDSPVFFDHAYRTALPFVSMGAMLNPTLGTLLRDHQLPPDLTWLAPIGTWSAVLKADDDGLTGFSTSGIGNQGVFLTSGLGAYFFGLTPGRIYGVSHPSAAPAPVPLTNPAAPTSSDTTTNAPPADTNVAPTTPAPATNTDVNPSPADGTKH